MCNSRKKDNENSNDNEMQLSFSLATDVVGDIAGGTVVDEVDAI